MPQQGLFSSTPGIQFFSPEELSTLPLVDPTTVVGIQAIGYDPNNPARLVRVNAAASDTSGNSTAALTQWTQPTAIAITAAGNSNVASSSARTRYLTQRVNVTAFTGTATVTLQNTSAQAGDKRRFIVAMPAGFANKIELRNLTSGGTLLATVPMDGALARTWLGYSTFDGTNWGAVSFSPMSVDEFVMARTAFRTDYVNSDGATSNRSSGIYGPFDAVNNPREWIAGAAVLTEAIVITVPASGSNADLCLYTPTINVNYTGRILRVTLSGADLIIFTTGSTVSDSCSFTYTGFCTAYVGRTIFLKITFTQGTANPVVEVNGVNISASFTLTTNNPPAWLDAALTPTYRMVGFNWPAGPAPIVTPILGATSAADDAFYMATGKWPAWVVAGGQCNTMSNFTFVGGGASGGGGTVGSSASANGITLTKTAGSAGYYYVANGACMGALGGNGQAIQGKQFFISGTASYSSGAGTLYVKFENTTSFITFNSSGAFSGYITADVSATNYRLIIGSLVSGDASVVVITNFVIAPTGALSLPSVQPINVLDDVSGIGGNQGRLLGCTPVTDKTSWRVSANTWMNGNQQILAGSILDSTKDVLEHVEQSTTGTPTTTIGSVSAGSQYKSSSTLTAGINPVTLVTRKLASNDIWVNSSSTAVVRTNIVGYRTN